MKKTSAMPRTLFLGLAVLLGLLMEANGVFMLAAPADWYFAVPGVPSTGPFNQHFLRDIGIVFLFLGTAFLMGAARPGARVGLWSAATLWLSCHALFHLWEVAAGICGPSAILRDFPAVTLPAILGAVLSFWAAREARVVRTEKA